MECVQNGWVWFLLRLKAQTELFAGDQQGLPVFTAGLYRVCPQEHGLREFQVVAFLLNSFVIMNFFTDSEFEGFQCVF